MGTLWCGGWGSCSSICYGLNPTWPISCTLLESASSFRDLLWGKSMSKSTALKLKNVWCVPPVEPVGSIICIFMCVCPNLACVRSKVIVKNVDLWFVARMVLVQLCLNNKYVNGLLCFLKWLLTAPKHNSSFFAFCIIYEHICCS